MSALIWHRWTPPPLPETKTKAGNSVPSIPVKQNNEFLCLILSLSCVSTLWFFSVKENFDESQQGEKKERNMTVKWSKCKKKQTETLLTMLREKSSQDQQTSRFLSQFIFNI